MENRNMQKWKTDIWIGLACMWLIVNASDAAAHNVTVFAWVEGNTVHTESKFSGGRKAKNAPIEVYDSTGNLLLSGETDDQGNFSFPIPRKTKMKVVLQAGMGHKAEWIIATEDLEEINQLPSAPPAAADTPARVAPGSQPLSDKAEPQLSAAASAGATEADIEKAVEKVLDKKLKPVLKMLADSRQTGPDLRDILGGLGYIIGLAGLAAYLSYRRSKKSSDSSAAGSEPPATGNQ